MNKMEESGKSNLVEPTTYTRRSLFSEDELLEPTTGSNAEDEILEPTSGCNDDEGMLEPTSGCNDDEEVSKPTTGMVFKTEVELIKYYKKYGKQTGFGIMTQRSRRTQDESVKYITFGCASGGKARNCSINLVKPRLTTKTECKARINAVLRQLDLVVEAGGFDKLPFIEKDARNYIDKARHLRLGKGGVVALRDYFTPDELEASWEVFLNTYNLHNHVWLQSLYSEQMHWIPVYLKYTFWAGMSTTQRSESMNAFFDGFVHSGTMLKEFVDQFDNALRKKVENEIAADFHSWNCTIPCITHLPVEKQIQELYTNSKFKEDVQVLPSKYIMDRWRKDIKRQYALIWSSYDDLSGKPAASRYSMLIKLCYEVATNAAECDDNAIDMAQKLRMDEVLQIDHQHHDQLTQLANPSTN
ncbi:hypothetical protein F2P56_018737 [Juglans regia]|uniref:Protein FAR1-RELATED SEQUENCE n=1 Tax=Juglans regia TaxID=51240 RepID=A0A833U5Q4_JUGRE|nr:hypothetical protein F2P56_018737 [Juglans regia]